MVHTDLKYHIDQAIIFNIARSIVTSYYTIVLMCYYGIWCQNMKS